MPPPHLDDPDPGPDPESVARTICLRLLTAAPRTRADLAAALRRRRVPAEAAERVLDRFVEVGLLDDAAFAEAYVVSRQGSRGLGRRALAGELRRRGVADEAVAVALERVGPEDEEQAARRLVQRRLAATAGLAPDVRTRRLAAMLARKGYPPGLALRVVRQALMGEDAPGKDAPGEDVPEWPS